MGDTAEWRRTGVQRFPEQLAGGDSAGQGERVSWTPQSGGTSTRNLGLAVTSRSQEFMQKEACIRPASCAELISGMSPSRQPEAGYSQRGNQVLLGGRLASVGADENTDCWPGALATRKGLVESTGWDCASHTDRTPRHAPNPGSRRRVHDCHVELQRPTQTPTL